MVCRSRNLWKSSKYRWFLLFRFPRPWTKNVCSVRQRSSKNRTISCKSCVLDSGETEKLCRYSLFRSFTDSWILWSIFSSHFPTDFLQTNVYLFAQVSKFHRHLPEIRCENEQSTMIRGFLPGQQPHKVDVSFAGAFYLSWGINVLRISVGQNLEHGLWVNRRISAFGRVSLIQQAVI